MQTFVQTFVKGESWSGDLLALLAGAVFPLCFAPFDYWFLGIVCMITLLLTLGGAGNARGVWRFYLFAVGMYGVGVSWIYVSIHTYGGASPLLAGLLVVGFVLSFSTISALHGFLYMRYVRHLPLGVVLGFPCLWVIQEWFRTWFLTGFPWLFAGYAHLSTPLSGYAPVFGILGVSFALTLTATCLYNLLRCLPKKRLRHVDKRCAVVYVVVLLTIWLGGHGLTRIEFVTPTEHRLSVSLVQGNVDQATKWRRSMVNPILNLYTELTEEEWGRDLIVWPEAAVTLFRKNAAFFLDELDARGKSAGSTVVLGIPDRDEAGNYQNTAIALGDGSGSYRKRRLVPFGEYVPLENQLRGTIQFFDLPMSRNRPGPENQAPLYVGHHRMSLSICYEVVYPELVRSTVDNPDLLVTISNDTWFGRSIGPDQHLQMARMRALENGRYMVRGTNNGITVIADHRGRIKARLPRFEQGVLRGEVAILSGRTPWSLWGNWPMLALLFGLLVVLWLRYRYDIRRVHSSGNIN